MILVPLKTLKTIFPNNSNQYDNHILDICKVFYSGGLERTKRFSMIWINMCCQNRNIRITLDNMTLAFAHN